MIGRSVIHTFLLRPVRAVAVLPGGRSARPGRRPPWRDAVAGAVLFTTAVRTFGLRRTTAASSVASGMRSPSFHARVIVRDALGFLDGALQTLLLGRESLNYCPLRKGRKGASHRRPRPAERRGDNAKRRRHHQIPPPSGVDLRHIHTRMAAVRRNPASKDDQGNEQGERGDVAQLHRPTGGLPSGSARSAVGSEPYANPVRTQRRCGGHEYQMTIRASATTRASTAVRRSFMIEESKRRAGWAQRRHQPSSSGNRSFSPPARDSVRFAPRYAYDHGAEEAERDCKRGRRPTSAFTT
jgi:hypothetical protein